MFLAQVERINNAIMIIGRFAYYLIMSKISKNLTTVWLPSKNYS